VYTIDVKNIGRLYLIYGAERYLARHNEKRLRDAISGGAFSDMNETVFSGKQASSGDIVDAAETLPLFAERRVVVVRGSGLFAPGRKDESEKMAAFVSDVPETSVLIFVEADVDKRSALYKRVAKHGAAISCDKPADSDILRWVQNYLKKRGANITRGAAVAFTRTVTGGMDQMASELDKLASYSDGVEITPKDIEAVCTRSPESDIFKMVGAIGKRDAQTALNILNDLLSLKESSFGLLAMITRQFRLIMQVKALLSDGLGQPEIAKALSLRPFQVRDYAAQAQNFERSVLERALINCLKAGADIKSGRLKDRLALELLIVS